MSLRGVPSGLVWSQIISPVKPMIFWTRLARSWMEISWPEPMLMIFGIAVIFHEEDTGLGEVVGVKKFAEGRTGAPTGDGRGVGNFGIVKFADEGGEDVGGSGDRSCRGGPYMIGGGMAEMKSQLYWRRRASQSLRPAILAMAYHLVAGFERAGEGGILP